MARTRSGSVISLRPLAGIGRTGRQRDLLLAELAAPAARLDGGVVDRLGRLRPQHLHGGLRLLAGTPGLSRAIVVSQNMLGVFQARVAAGLTTGNMVSGINASASWPL